jgi:hypothetical protein
MQQTMTWMTVCLGTLFVTACAGMLGGCDGASGKGNDAGAGGDGGQWGTASSSSSGSGQGGAGNAGSSVSSSSSVSSGSSSGWVDPYPTARQACVDKINALRATKGLPALQRWADAEPCVDQQATYDEMNNKPHGAWGMQLYPSCNGSGQNECLGQGPGGIEGCLDQMWGEKDQAGCSGCDACSDMYNPNCPGCDFYGQTSGDVCGHYVNMSAKYFTRVACGFSSLGGWDAINFQ